VALSGIVRTAGMPAAVAGSVLTYPLLFGERCVTAEHLNLDGPAADAESPSTIVGRGSCGTFGTQTANQSRAAGYAMHGHDDGLQASRSTVKLKDG